MHFDVLLDIKKIMCVLINCRVTDEAIYCGCAAFRGGISGAIDITDGIKTFTIEIPDTVKDTVNWLTIVDSKDNYKLTRIIKNAS